MNTTISISKKTRDLLKEYGKKSENYDDIIKRMYNDSMLRMSLEKFIYSKGFVTLKEAEEWTELKIKADESKNINNKRTERANI